jgi:hypothetical protein
VNAECNGKRRHESLRRAEAEARRLRRKERRQGLIPVVTAYGCSACQGFHVGHPSPRMIQRLTSCGNK